MDTSNTTSSIFKIEKLNGPSNWMWWKRNIKMILIYKGLWSHVAPDTGLLPLAVAATEEQIQKGQEALSIIYFACDEGQQMFIFDAADGRTAYKILNDLYSSNDYPNRIARKAAFFGLHQDTNETAAAWAARVSDEAAECAMVGETISDNDKLAVTLNGLIKSSEHMITPTSFSAKHTSNRHQQSNSPNSKRSKRRVQLVRE